jgi:2-amino-4-hydroxy-6-hydroxymethyldihydropteridine diphosphokinase
VSRTEHSTGEQTATVYLGLGSNLGNRARNIYEALRRLRSHVRLDRVSSLYETEPVGLTDQPWFLNLVCSGQTALPAESLLVAVKGIERDMGRKEGIRFGPRVIDIDILFYDDLVMETERLQIPHPRLHERGFVLIPLMELAPDLVHPVLNSDVRELVQKAAPLKTTRPYRLMDGRASS